MKRVLVVGYLLIALLLLPAPRVLASPLTEGQIGSLISLIKSFGIETSILSSLKSSLLASVGAISSTATPSTTFPCTFTRTLGIGSSGPEVTCLQTWLMRNGFPLQDGATGYYGIQTRVAVVAWKKFVGIPATGSYFDATAQAAWKKAIASTSTSQSTTSSKAALDGISARLTGINAELGSLDTDLSHTVIGSDAGVSAE